MYLYMFICWFDYIIYHQSLENLISTDRVYPIYLNINEHELINVIKEWESIEW